MSRLCGYAIVLLGLLYVASIFSALPFATNDGPIHIAFGNFLGLDTAVNPLLFSHYRLDDTFSPNVAVYMLIAALLKVLTPGVTESLVQVLCTVGIVASGWFALHQVRSGSDKTWLALLVFPLTLHRLFFFGLYNFCFSISGFFLVIGEFLRLQERTTPGRAAGVIAALYFTFFAHAAGFLAAVVAISALAGTQAVVSHRGGERWKATLWAQRTHLLVLASPLPLVLFALGSNGNTPFAYGIGLDERVSSLARLEVLRVHYGFGEEIAKLLSLVLLGGVAALAVGLWNTRRVAPATQERGGATGALAVFVAMVTLSLAFPDTLGGGWAHFQRMALFPYFAAVLCLAHCSIRKGTQTVVASFAAIVTVALLVDTVAMQREIVRQMQPLDDVDRLVGRHCSVLPLVLSSKPLDEDGRSLVMRYNPYFQIVTRLELARDRVSLFNYQARTGVYPVGFQNGHDTQELIFHWTPMQASTAIETIDIDGFEASSGMSIDYVLQWGPIGVADPELRQRVLQAEHGAERVYESQDGRVVLFRRATGGQSPCRT